MSRPLTRRKCPCCNLFFLPDPRTERRQRYCSEPSCQQASKAASQQRWLSKNGNGDYFRGPDQVCRVQAWRKRNPGYWKRTTPASETPQLVNPQPTNPGDSSCNVPKEESVALQDQCLSQHPAFVGLISMVTGRTLQEEIAATTRQLLLRGRNILGSLSPPTSSIPVPI